MLGACAGVQEDVGGTTYFYVHDESNAEPSDVPAPQVQRVCLLIRLSLSTTNPISYTGLHCIYCTTYPDKKSLQFSLNNLN